MIGPDREIHPILSEDLEDAPLAFRYDRFGDKLVVSFGEPRATFGVPRGEWQVLLLDIRTDEVVGVEFEHFLKASVYAFPVLSLVLEQAGVSPPEARRVRRELERRGNDAARNAVAVGLERTMLREGLGLVPTPAI